MLVAERFTDAGDWQDDPTLIDVVRTPTWVELDENGASAVQQEILAGADAGEQPAK